MKIDLVPGAIPYKSRVSLLNPDQKENLHDHIDEFVKARSDRNFTESLGIGSSTREEGRTNEMSHRSERIE